MGSSLDRAGRGQAPQAHAAALRLLCHPPLIHTFSHTKSVSAAKCSSAAELSERHGAKCSGCAWQRCASDSVATKSLSSCAIVTSKMMMSSWCSEPGPYLARAAQPGVPDAPGQRCASAASATDSSSSRFRACPSNRGNMQVCCIAQSTHQPERPAAQGAHGRSASLARAPSTAQVSAAGAPLLQAAVL